MNRYVISSCRKRARGQSYQQLLVFTPPCPPNSICLCLPGSAGDIALPFSTLVREEWQPLIKAEGQFKPPYILVPQFLCGFIFTQLLPALLSPQKVNTFPFLSKPLSMALTPFFPLQPQSHAPPISPLVSYYSFSQNLSSILQIGSLCLTRKASKIKFRIISFSTPQSNFLKHLSALPHQNGGTYHHNVFIFLHLFPDLLVKAESPLPPSLSQLCVTPLVSCCRRGGWTQHFNRPILLKDN